ncbi:putative monovalent cation/H+ antiporter subunit A [compost metagenome]
MPSALFFDIGVFALVLGATMLILTALAHQSIRSHRWADEQEEKEAQARAAAEAEEAATATGGAR